MSAAPPDRRLLIEAIGHELVADATEPQREEIWEAVQRNPDGVKRLAGQIRSNPRVKKPIPVLLSKLRDGAHQAPSRGTDQKLSQIEAAHRMYVAKLADLDKHDAWPEGWTVDDAVAYAIDHVCPSNFEVETELRKRAGLEPYIVAEGPPPEALDAMRRLAAGKPLPLPKPKPQPPIDPDDEPIVARA